MTTLRIALANLRFPLTPDESVFTVAVSEIIKEIRAWEAFIVEAMRK